MCVLIIKLAGVELPSLATLNQCRKANPDGQGFACNGIVFKTLNFEEFCVRLYEKVKVDDSCIIHFRFATHGSVRVSNCHPFADSGTGLAFAHNGVLDIKAEADKTDSEVFFRKVAIPTIKKYGLKAKETHETIEKWRGGSRFAFMKRNGEVVKFGEYYKVNGCYFSNLRWMKSPNDYLSLRNNFIIA